MVSFYAVAAWGDAFTYLLAFTLFLQILEFLALLKFNEKLASFFAVLRESSSHLVSFACIFICAQMLFGTTAYLLFGQKMYNYRNFLHTMYSQLTAVLRKFNSGAMFNTAGWTSRIFLFTCSFTMVYLLLSVLVAILTDSYRETKKRDITEASELLQLLINKILGRA